MSGELRTVGDDDDTERCAWCGAVAAGACARCQRSVCGDCCVLTTGGVRTWAICPDCDVRGGGSLRSEWITVGGWVLGLLVMVFAAAVVFYLVLRD